MIGRRLVQKRKACTSLFCKRKEGSGACCIYGDGRLPFCCITSIVAPQEYQTKILIVTTGCVMIVLWITVFLVKFTKERM